MKAQFYQCPICEERYVARQDCLCGTKANDLLPVYDMQPMKPQVVEHQLIVKPAPKKEQSALGIILGCISIFILIFI